MKSLPVSSLRTFLLALVGLFLFSCDDPYKVGLDLQKNEQLIKTYFKDDHPIATSVVLMDSISNTDRDATTSLRATRAMLGILKDPQFGTTKATIYSKVHWDGRKILDSVDRASPDVSLIGLEAYDSVVLRLRTPLISNTDAISLNRMAEGDTSATLIIRVERLAQELDTTKTYFINHPDLPVTELLGSATVKPIFRKTAVGNNTFVYHYEMRVRLNDDFGRSIFDKSGKPELATKAAFENMIKGLKISVENTNSTALWNIDLNLSSNSSGIDLFYRYKSSNKAQSVTYNLTANPVAQAQWFTKLETDYNGTPFLSKIKKNEPMPTSNLGNQLFIQDGTGLGVHLDFPTLRGLNKNDKDSLTVVNRAELYFEPLNNAAMVGANQTPPSELFLYIAASPTTLASGSGKTNLGYEYSFLYPILRDAANNSEPPLYFTYIPTAITYSNGFLSKYIQNLIDGTDNGKGLFMVAGFTLSSTQGALIVKHDYALNKVIIPDGNPINGNKRLRLKLYYTKVKKI